ncbi:MAG: O-antigen polysaccharide polymerase Wzy, partial [Staphylococcus equorum]|nr:O-antigen polysaccharide polymerase Wzy [Staphylococcus equorum]
LNLFNIIKEMRKLPANIWLNDLPSLFVDSFVNSNPILEVVYEIGIALAPTAAAIEYVPSLINVQYGKTILYSITTAVPDVFNIRPQVMSIYGNVGSLLSTQADSQFGASILQDFFVNFMWATPFFMLIVGFLVKKFSRKLAYEGDFVKLVFYSSLIYPVLWWPRSSLSYILRYFFTAVVIPMLLYYFLKKIYYQREKAHKS